MNGRRTEDDIRQWLAAGAAEVLPSPELEARVVAIPRASARRGWVIVDWTARRRVAIALAAALVLAALVATAAFVGRRPPAPSFRQGQLAYVVGDRLYLADADGQHPLPITDAIEGVLKFGLPHWHGSVLTFKGSDGVDAPINGSHDFVRDASGVRDVSGAFDWATTVAFDPQASRVATLALDQVVIRSLDGRLLESLPSPAGYAEWDGSDLQSLDWLSGDELIVGGCREMATCLKGSSDGHDLLVVPLDGRNPRAITAPNEPAFGAAASPDGSRLAFQYLPPVDRWAWDRAQLWVMRGDGSGRRKLDTPRGVFAFAWSPDGRRIAFTLRTPETEAIGHGLWIVDVDGLAPAREIAAADFTTDWPMRLAWSADRVRVLMAGSMAGADAGSAGSTGLWTFDASGGKPSLLVPGATDGDWQLIRDEP